MIFWMVSAWIDAWLGMLALGIFQLALMIWNLIPWKRHDFVRSALSRFVLALGVLAAVLLLSAALYFIDFHLVRIGLDMALYVVYYPRICAGYMAILGAVVLILVRMEKIPWMNEEK